MTARKDPGAIVYIDNDPWAMESTDLYNYFWDVAKRTELFALYLNKCSELAVIRSKQKNPVSLTSKVFPVGSPRRGRMTKLFPKGSPQYKLAKAALNKMRVK